MAVKILGIETSCDETAASVIEDGRKLLSNVIASQVDIHSRYGGVVPEVASRQHVIQMAPTVQQAMEDARVNLRELDAVAVTYGPGLAGALLVGANFAKALAFSLGIPLLGVNHLEGHIYAAWLHSGGSEDEKDPEVEPGFPLMCLIASGGHTDLVLMEGHGGYKLLGRTRDDAAGEAFDKAARILGLGFPGGPEIQRASAGAQIVERLPRAWLRGTHDFSFSGVKTALLHKAQDKKVYPPGELDDEEMGRLVKEMAASFQDSVVDVMVQKTLEAADKYGARGILLGGGVTANALLRERMSQESRLPTLIPAPVLCTDNGAMIAAAGYYHRIRGRRDLLDLDVDPGLSLG
jgi:N6-L-threonylcarbamoyladenine synthase